MKSIIVAALLAAATVAVVWPEESEQRIVVKKPYDPSENKGRPGGGPTTILYHGGAVLNQAPTVYVIFYGNFATTSATAATIIKNFLADINGAATDNPYEVNTGYDDSSAGTGTHIQPMFFYTPDAFPGNPSGSLYYDNYSLGMGKTISSNG